MNRFKMGPFPHMDLVLDSEPFLSLQTGTQLNDKQIMRPD